MKVLVSLSIIAGPLLAALPAFAANVCIATLEEQDLPLFNKFRSIVTCHELDPGCRYRASCVYASNVDAKSEWTTVVGTTLSTYWQENYFPMYGNPIAVWDIEC
jgi:hypothetical protein